MKISDCCDAIPYNDIIDEAYGQYYGLCGECREHCGFHDMISDDDCMITYKDIAEGNAEVGGSVGAEDSPQKFK